MAVHIGSIIRQYCKDNRIDLNNICEKIGIDPSTARKIFLRDRIYVDTVHSFSRVLKHNFFQYFIDDLPVGPVAEMERLQNELDEAKQKLEELNEEIEAMRRKNETLLIENQVLNKFLDRIKSP
jgi:hypothetical protein